MSESPALTRYRVAYRKEEALRYTGHLDLHHAWEKTLRRGQLALAYSQGFHPQPRLQQACALPLGFTSRAEIIDFWLDDALPAGQVEQALRQAAPPGIAIDQVSVVDLHEPALQTRVISAAYRVDFLDPPPVDQLAAAIQATLSAEHLPREWRGKPYDLRPLIEELRLEPPVENRPHPSLGMRLAAREGATGRPEEALACLGQDPRLVKVERTHLFLKD